MPFQIKSRGEKASGVYKTIYLPETLREQVEQVAAANHTSFNKIVVDMIKYCLNDLKEQET